MSTAAPPRRQRGAPPAPASIAGQRLALLAQQPCNARTQALAALDAARNNLVCAWLALPRHIARALLPGASIQQLDDLAEEGTLALMDAAEHFDPTLGFKFGTFAGRAIARRLITANEKARRRRMLSLSRVRGWWSEWEPPCAGPDPVEVAQRHEEAAHLRRLLERLWPDEADVLVACFWEEITLRDLAVEWGTSKQFPGQVRKRALGKLRGMLGERRES